MIPPGAKNFVIQMGALQPIIPDGAPVLYLGKKVGHVKRLMDELIVEIDPEHKDRVAKAMGTPDVTFGWEG